MVSVADNACEINWDEDNIDSMDDILDAIKTNADRLKKIHRYQQKGKLEDILNIDDLVFIINNDIFNHFQTCGFCKAEEHRHRIFLFSEDKSAVDYIKNKIDEAGGFISVETKSREVYNEKIDYWILRFKYMDLTDYLVELVKEFMAGWTEEMNDKWVDLL